MTAPEYITVGCSVVRIPDAYVIATAHTDEIAWALAQVLNGEWLLDLTDAEADRVQSILWP